MVSYGVAGINGILHINCQHTQKDKGIYWLN